MPAYAPPSENDTEEYIGFMRNQLDEMAGYAGSATGIPLQYNQS